MTEPLPSLPSLPSLPPLPSLGAVVRRPPAGGARRQWQQARVVDVREETPVVRSVTLELPEPAEAHVPGQHYVVRATDASGAVAQRSYSVASAPELPSAPRPGRRIQLTVERFEDGELSPWLHERAVVGEHWEVRGPFGGWFVWRGDVPAVLLGGGTGLVPLMAMLRHWRATGERVPLRLLTSVRTPEDVLYRDELAPEQLAFTRLAPPGTARPPHRIDADDVRPLLLDGATYYVCGSAGFAEHAGSLLVDAGVDPGAVRVERFGPS